MVFCCFGIDGAAALPLLTSYGSDTFQLMAKSCVCRQIACRAPGEIWKIFFLINFAS